MGYKCADSRAHILKKEAGILQADKKKVHLFYTWRVI